ncbi:tyrosine--tRNA ligase [Candidatus Methylomirabilis sp.]|uniref:tyrosine--tRNA ligase n=1 Tax=Candidatus Methylomirabilis sp. TaxID=2032687 RepID=UPI002A674EF4|nr:tyrosine--tRNA ligase [Candidatus Methylomirabilis sp.]
MNDVKAQAYEQLCALRHGVVEIVSEEELLGKLERSLRTGVPLRVKLGADPSAPDLHLGHTVVLRKLRQFQDLGHQVIFLIGDFTGMIGDPTGRSETRKPLSVEEIQANATTYKKQIFRILDQSRTEIRFNSEWLNQMGFTDVIRLAAQYTVARLLERDDFQKRYREGRPIGVHEFLYPLAQGHDSVVLRADVELGGTDQKFNLLVGRELQRDHGQEPQVALITPLLEGTDGVQKMSKSLGNYIGIDEPAREVYGKTMSIPDALIVKYAELVAGMSPDAIEAMEEGLKLGTLHPRSAKADVARRLVALYHGEQAADEAAHEFDRIFREKRLPDVILEFQVPEGHIDQEEGIKNTVPLAWLIAASSGAKSISEAKRLIRQGGVSLDGEVIRDEYAKVPTDQEYVLRVGKRFFRRIKKSIQPRKNT